MESLFKGFSEFLRSSWISLIIILIVFGLSWIDQGQTVFIDLLNHNPWNLLVFFILLTGLANILSHYPVFIDTRRRMRFDPKAEDKIVWRICYKNLPWWIHWTKPVLKFFKRHVGIGFITYKSTKSSNLLWRDCWESRRTGTWIS